MSVPRSSKFYRGRLLKKPQSVSFQRDGYLILRDLISNNQASTIQAWVDEVQGWEIHEGIDFMPYHEINSKGDLVLSRTENFVNSHPGLEAFLTGSMLTVALDDLYEGEKPILFKDKINYKLAGSGGFAAHIDAGAYTHVNDVEHLTVLIAVDDATMSNGCMEVVKGSHKMDIPIGTDNCISPDWTAQQQWTPVELRAGDVLIFGSYLAHRSSANNSDQDRRAIYATYNRWSQGNHHKEYYRRRREEWPPTHLRKPGDKFEEGAWIHANGTPMMSVDLGHQLQV